MTGYEKGGIKLNCTAAEHTAGKVSILDSFVNSDNPEKDLFLDYITQAAEDPAKEKLLVDMIFDGWGVNGANIFNVIGFEYINNYMTK